MRVSFGTSAHSILWRSESYRWGRMNTVHRLRHEMVRYSTLGHFDLRGMALKYLGQKDQDWDTMVSSWEEAENPRKDDKKAVRTQQRQQWPGYSHKRWRYGGKILFEVWREWSTWVCYPEYRRTCACAELSGPKVDHPFKSDSQIRRRMRIETTYFIPRCDTPYLQCFSHSTSSTSFRLR